MKISVIVPSNSKIRINKFVDEYRKLEQFRCSSRLVIVGNGELKKKDIPNEKWINYIQFEGDFKNNIVNFVELRGVGMQAFSTDFFMFLDDDHTFEEKSDDFLVKCIDFLIGHKECGVLQIEKDNKTKDGFYVKENAHIWTSRGLFIRNTKFNYENLYKLKGACEELLYGYEVLNNSYIPYCIWNSGIKRHGHIDTKYKEKNDPSYSENLLDKNIIGYIRNKYDDKDWKFYGHLRALKYPNFLRSLIKSRLSNLIY